MTMTRIAALGLLVATVAGCGASTEPLDPASPTEQIGPTDEADLAYQTLLVGCQLDHGTVQAAVAAYFATAGAFPTIQQLIDGYDPDGAGPAPAHAFLGTDVITADYAFEINTTDGSVTAVKPGGGTDTLTDACNALAVARHPVSE